MTVLIRFDECLSRNVVAAMRQLGLPDGIAIEHPSERGEISASDVDWISSLRERDGRCVVSADPKMRGRLVERLALQSSGLVAIFPPNRKGWFAGLRRYGQAGYLIVWLPIISELAKTAEPGTHFMLPPSFDVGMDKVSRLRPLSGPSLEEVSLRHQRQNQVRSSRRKSSAD